MSIVLLGSTSGSCTLQEQAVAGTSVLTLPVGTGTVVVNNVNSAIVSGTAQASTSGTAINYTSVIPSWVKRITVMLDSVSSNGIGNPQIQIGTGGSYTIAGYVSSTYSGGAGGATSTTTGFTLLTATAAAGTYTGSLVISLLDSNVWVANGSFTRGDNPAIISSSVGKLSLGGTLDSVRLICSATGSPSDTFDAGSINILYE